MREQPFTVYTIGHSNQQLDAFIGLLQANGIEVLVDLRSSPFASYAKYFDAPALNKALATVGIKYLDFGGELGGKPGPAVFYDVDGRVRYDLLARSPAFVRGIQRLKAGSQRYHVAIMCSEEDPTGCHRRLLVGRVLARQGASIVHIRGTGELQTEEDLLQDEQKHKPDGAQLSLLAPPEEMTWKSAKPIQSASRSGPRRTSSERSNRPVSSG